jgi:predicted ATPase
LEGGKRLWDHAERLSAENASGATEAESCFRKAIDVARRQQAKSWEPRATMSLARLLDKQERRDEARAMLAECTAGSPRNSRPQILKDTKALLDELNE